MEFLKEIQEHKRVKSPIILNVRRSETVLIWVCLPCNVQHRNRLTTLRIGITFTNTIFFLCVLFISKFPFIGKVNIYST